MYGKVTFNLNAILIAERWTRHHLMASAQHALSPLTLRPSPDMVASPRRLPVPSEVYVFNVLTASSGAKHPQHVTAVLIVQNAAGAALHKLAVRVHCLRCAPQGQKRQSWALVLSAIVETLHLCIV